MKQTKNTEENKFNQRLQSIRDTMLEDYLQRRELDLDDRDNSVDELEINNDSDNKILSSFHELISFKCSQFEIIFSSNSLTFTELNYYFKIFFEQVNKPTFKPSYIT